MDEPLPIKGLRAHDPGRAGLSRHRAGSRAVLSGSARAMKLSERVIAGLTCPADTPDRLVFDDAVPGLGLRVSRGGNRSFLVQYTTPAGRRRRVPIGRWGAITLDQARTAARAIHGDIARGLDPAELRARARDAAVAEAATARLTLRALLDGWAAGSLAQRRESYRREALRALRTAFRAQLDRPADALARADAVATLDAMVRSGRHAIAGRTLAYGRACYGWALARGTVALNPFAGLPIPSGAVSRDRVLDDAEVAAVWAALGAMPHPFGPALRVLLLTAQRRDEVAGMRWSEVSEDRATWTIPKERAKNGRAHAVHLAAPIRAILAGVPVVEGHADFVFTTTGKTAVSGFSRAKLALDNAARVRGEPLPPWRLHDFRRTAVTWMAGHGVAPYVADRLLNHVSGTISGVAAVYQRGEFLAERRAALDAWAAHVAGLG